MGALTVGCLSVTLGALLAASAPTSVAVDLSGLTAAEWAEVDGAALERRLLVRLVQDGFAVVGRGAGADVELKVLRLAGGLALVAHSAARDAEATAGGAGTLEELHLEAVQKAVELVHAAAPPAAAPPAAAAAAPAPPPVSPPPPKRWGFDLGGALGFVVRQGGADPALRLSGRYGWRWLGGELSFGLWVASQGTATVLQLPVTIGFSARVELGHGVWLEGALAGGVLVQGFFVSDPAAAERAGVRADAVGMLPVSLLFFPLQSIGGGVRLTPGLCSGGLQVGGFSRGPFWFEAAGVAQVRF